jgi:Ca2+-binding EF-hand superfamily protein
MKKLATISLAAFLLSSTAVLAQSMQAFDNLDSDGDDKLSYSDLIGQWPDLSQEQFDAADIDGDDFLDATQFEALQSQLGSPSSTEIAAAGVISPSVDVPVFENVDADGDGKISIDDLTGWGVTQDVFDTADIDGDDFLDPTQYESLKGLLAAGTTTAVEVGAVSSPSTLPLFEDVDSDGDGQIAFSDLKIALPDVTQDQFDSADMDNDDFLDPTQYESLKGVLAAGTTPAVEVGAASSPSTLPLFEDVDSDGDGQIAFSDLKIALPDVTQDQFDSADVDDNDVLDRTQYEALQM